MIWNILIKPGKELNTQAVMPAYTKESQSLAWKGQKQLVPLFVFFPTKRGDDSNPSAQPNYSWNNTSLCSLPVKLFSLL